MPELKFATNHRAAELCPCQQQASSVLPSVVYYWQLTQALHLQCWLKNLWPRHLFKHWVNTSLDGW